MGKFEWVTFEEGRARFAGFEGGREGRLHFVFSIELPNGRPFFGEFVPVFESDGNHFNIEVVSFGYRCGEDVDRSEPQFRVVFSPAQALTIQQLFRKLVMLDSDKPVPLDMRAWPNFRKEIAFREGWIRTA